MLLSGGPLVSGPAWPRRVSKQCLEPDAGPYQPRLWEVARAELWTMWGSPFSSREPSGSFYLCIPGTDILASPQGGVRALRSGVWQDCLRAGAGGGRVRLPSPICHSMWQGWGQLCCSLSYNTCELWESCSGEGRTSHQGWAWPSSFEKENVPTKHELLQEKPSNLTHSPSFALHTCWENTPTDSSTGYCSYLTPTVCFPPMSFRPPLHRGSAQGWAGKQPSSALPLHGQHSHSCLSQSALLSVGYHLITAALACQSSLQPSDLPTVVSCSLFVGLHCSPECVAWNCMKCSLPFCLSYSKYQSLHNHLHCY